MDPKWSWKYNRNNIILFCIILISFILRVWHLNYQSLDLDELHTMNESNPTIKWSELFGYLNRSDQHPPLHFIICRFCFALFGHTEFIARFISALFGTAAVWAMYLLGKEILDKRLGTTAAAFTCVNYFEI